MFGRAPGEDRQRPAAELQVLRLPFQLRSRLLQPCRAAAVRIRQHRGKFADQIHQETVEGKPRFRTVPQSRRAAVEPLEQRLRQGYHDRLPVVAAEIVAELLVTGGQLPDDFSRKCEIVELQRLPAGPGHPVAVVRPDPDQVAVPEAAPFPVDLVFRLAGENPENFVEIVPVLLDLSASRQMVFEQLQDGGGTEAERFPMQDLHNDFSAIL